MGCAPFFAIALGVLIVSITRGEALSQKAYARAGDVATEVFSQQRTVASYSGEEHEVRRYDRFLTEAEREGIKKGVALGFSVGLMLFSFYAMYGISTYAGAEFIIMSRTEDPECRLLGGVKASCFTGHMLCPCALIVFVCFFCGFMRSFSSSRHVGVWMAPLAGHSRALL
jgi:hypothetical protein